jgi:hypothetical protein
VSTHPLASRTIIAKPHHDAVVQLRAWHNWRLLEWQASRFTIALLDS